MHYVQNHKEIVQRYKVKLVGWTHPTFANPSELSASLLPLQILLDAIKSGQCKFVWLTPEEYKKEDNEYHEKLKNGDIIPRECKTRKDKGKKWKRKVREMQGATRSQIGDYNPIVVVVVSGSGVLDHLLGDRFAELSYHSFFLAVQQKVNRQISSYASIFTTSIIRGAQKRCFWAMQSKIVVNTWISDTNPRSQIQSALCSKHVAPTTCCKSVVAIQCL